MLMSDPISILFSQKSDYLIHFPQTPQDPSYILDLKEHLQLNQQYRKDRREYRNKHPKISQTRAHEDYFRQYVDEFHRDLEQFCLLYPEMPVLDLSYKFCKVWKLYDMFVGVELVERAILRFNYPYSN